MSCGNCVHAHQGNRDSTPRILITYVRTYLVLKLELLGEGDKRNPKPFLEGANQLELVPFDRHLAGLEFASVVKISKELIY